MKKTLLLFGLLIIISSCGVQQSSIDEAIEKGFSYLNTVYEDGVYNDQYLLYIYPGEKLECPLEGCTITYRILDAYFNLLFINNGL